MVKNAKPDFNTVIVTPVFRLSYPHIWEPQFNQLAKRNEYSIQMLFEKATAKASLAEMVKLVNSLVFWKWGSIDKNEIRRPFIDGDTKKDYAGVIYAEKNPAYKGMIIVKSWSKQAPGIVDATGKHPILQQDEVYGGCYCKALVNIYAYDQAGNKGISIGLNGLQKVRDGEPFGNRVRAEDAFSPVEGEASMADDNSMFG